MKAGQLHHRVELQKKHRTQRQETGAVEVQWDTVARVWAHIDPLSGRETIAAAAAQTSVDTRIKLRYRDDVVASWRVVHKGHAYDIEAVLPDNNTGQEYITLLCSRGPSDG